MPKSTRASSKQALTANELELLDTVMRKSSRKRSYLEEQVRRQSIIDQFAQDMQKKNEKIRHRASLIVGSALSQIEEDGLTYFERQVLRSEQPIKTPEINEKITVLNQKGIWLNKQEANDWIGDVNLKDYGIYSDPDPRIISKKPKEKLKFIQELSIKYLKPNPIRAGDIIISQEAYSTPKAAPPIIIRQNAPRIDTPEHLIYREEPPIEPVIPKKIIRIRGKQLPPPPRKVIIEKLAADPQKPPNISVERWLPYDQIERRVIFQKNEDIVKAPTPRNVIIEWAQPDYTISHKVKYLGVSREDTHEYRQMFGESLLKSKDLPEVVRQIETPNDLKLAADSIAAPRHKLVGDLEALKMIDLEAEGLGEYKEQLISLGIIPPEEDQMLLKMFSEIDTDQNGTISVDEARNIFERINVRLGKSYTPADALQFIISLDKNRDGLIEFSEFKAAFDKSSDQLTREQGPNYIDVEKIPANQSILSRSSINTRRPSGFKKRYSIKNIGPILSCPIGEDCTLDEILGEVHLDADGRVPKKEACKAIMRLDSVNQLCVAEEVEAFFDKLDRKRKGSISVAKFRSAFKEDEEYSYEV